ncbi:unnamed protein product [Closterium sp. NIES-65]|nr:unnamed protein product [Closterium sp. NIES-65]
MTAWPATRALRAHAPSPRPPSCFLCSLRPPLAAPRLPPVSTAGDTASRRGRKEILLRLKACGVLARAHGAAGSFHEARIGCSWRGSTWQLRSGRAAAGRGDGRGRMGGVGQARASVDELAGVLVLSAVPFVAVKALANSGLGGQLSQRLQQRLPELRRAADRVEAQREEAREQSPWYGPARPRWLDPLPFTYPAYLDGRVAGDFAFDPAGLARDPAAFQRYYNLEILHARWAMLGALGVVVPEALQRYSDTAFLEAVWWRVGGAKLAGDDLDYLGVPGLHIAGGQGVVVIAIAQFLLMLGPEYARYTGIAALEPLGVFLPGDINHPGGWLFDPLGLANDAERFEDLKVGCCVHGCAVCMGAVCMGAVCMGGVCMGVLCAWVLCAWVLCAWVLCAWVLCAWVPCAWVVCAWVVCAWVVCAWVCCAHGCAVRMGAVRMGAVCMGAVCMGVLCAWVLCAWVCCAHGCAVRMGAVRMGAVRMGAVCMGVVCMGVLCAWVLCAWVLSTSLDTQPSGPSTQPTDPSASSSEAQWQEEDRTHVVFKHFKVPIRPGTLAAVRVCKYCKYCTIEFKGGAFRCAQHLAKWKGQRSRDVRLCAKVPPDVRAAVHYEKKAANRDEKRRAEDAALDAVVGGAKKGRITDFIGDDAQCKKGEADNFVCSSSPAVAFPNTTPTTRCGATCPLHGRGLQLRGRLQELMADWPHIEYVPCATHVLDLLMEDVGKITWCKDIVDRCGGMITYVRNHHFTHNYLRSKAVKGGKGKQLVKPAGTRFGTNYIALSRLVQLRSTLSQLVLSEEFANWSAGARKLTADTFRGHVMDDTWWKNATYLVELLTISFKLTEDMNDKLEAGEKILPRAIADDIGKIVRRRWDESLACALHVVGRILNPANQDEGIFRNDLECTCIFKAFIARHYDGETFTNKVGEERRASLVLQEGLTAFLTLEGSFGLPEAIADREAVKAGKHSMVQWWGWHGTDHPHLASLACRALTQPVSALPCERGWASWESVHTARRNKLGSEKLRDLVYVTHNWHVVHKYHKRGESSAVLPGNTPEPALPEGYNKEEDGEEEEEGEEDEAMLADYVKAQHAHASLLHHCLCCSITASAAPPSLAALPTQVREIKNGRLAMMAWVGFAAQAVVTGQGVLDDWEAFLADPLRNNALTFALH